MNEKLILEKLEEIKSEIDYIKEHMVDADQILDEDDIKSLNEAEEDLKNGRTISLDKIKKEHDL